MKTKQMMNPRMMPTTKQASKHQFKKNDHRVMHAKTSGGMGDSYGQRMITNHKRSGHSIATATAADRRSMSKHRTSTSSCY